MFLGSPFAMAGSAISNTTASSSDIVTLSLSNLILDEVYVTKDVLIKFDWTIPKDWDFNTILYADFQGTTYGGNVNYSADVVSTIRIKKRFKGDFTWKTIYEKEINSSEDFAIEFYDYYEPSHKTVEYAYVAVIGNTEADVLTTEVYSVFDSYFICDANENYPMIIDAENEITFNRESATIVSPGHKYPYVVHNGLAKYYSGKMTATFIEINNCEIDAENGWKYRNKIDTFLTNGQAKILKSFEGDIWMVNITGNISRTNQEHYQYVTQNFEWVECGDPTMITDLYDNGFIDVDIDRE